MQILLYNSLALVVRLRRCGRNLKKSNNFSVEIFVDQATENQIRSLVEAQDSQLKINESSMKKFLKKNMV